MYRSQPPVHMACQLLLTDINAGQLLIQSRGNIDQLVID